MIINSSSFSSPLKYFHNNDQYFLVDELNLMKLLVNYQPTFEWWNQLDELISSSKNNDLLFRKDTREHILITKTGKIKIPITRYKLKFNNKVIHFDLQINLLKSKNQEIKDLILELFNYGMNQCQITRFLNNALDQSTICKMINKQAKHIVATQEFLIQKNILNNQIEKIKFLYLEVDDTYSKIRKNKTNIIKVRNRMIVAHTYDHMHKLRKFILLETKDLNDPNLKIEQLANLIQNKIKSLFEYEKLIVIGDGACWIRKLAKLLNGKFSLDHFHWQSMLFKTLGYSKSNTRNKKLFAFLKLKYGGKTLYKYLSSLILTNQLDLVFKELEWLIKQEFINQSKKIEIINLIKYLKNNQKGLNNFDQSWYIGSRTEHFVQNCIKHIIKRKYCTFGWSVYLMLLINNQNKHKRYLLL